MSQGIDRLKVWEAVKTAYGSIWLHKGRLAEWSVVPLVLIAVIEIFSQPYIAGLDRMLSGEVDAEWQSGVVAAGQLRIVLQIVVWTWLEMLVYRLFLLGPQADLTAAQRRSIFASLLVFNLAILALNTVPTVAFDYARIVGGVSQAELFSLLLVPVYLFVTVRLAFVFPAICLGSPWQLRQRWAETRGNVWRLLLAYLLGYLPMIALIIVFSSAGLDFATYELSSGVSPVVEAVARALVNLVAVLTGAAVTAAAVAQLTGFRASGMTGQGPGPTEIAKTFD